MTHAVFLCNKSWTITRTLHTSPDLTVPEGAGLFALLAPGSDQPEEGMAYSAVELQLAPGGPVLSGLVCAYPNAYLVAAAAADTQESIRRFNDLCAQCLGWASEHLQELYSDDYHEIQRMNNELINNQRALFKLNQRLKQALTEVQTANDTISALEQDVLTGLYRAPAFYRRVEQALAAAPGAPFEIIVLDIEYYTLVCDVFGKRAGALLLQALGLHLIGMPDAHCGLMARSVDDIFFFYMPAEVHFAQKLSASVSDFLDSYPLPIRMHALLGVYAANSADIPPAQMCDRARLALNIRGTVREDRIGYYDHTLQEHLLREHKLLDDIPDSLLNGDFRMYLQPKVDMLTGEVIGAEALVRWLHPELGFIPPDEFIPLLERDLSVYPVDCYIWEEACRFQAQRRAAGLAPMPVSLNVSRCDLYQPDLPQVLDGLLKKYDLTPRDLHLEVIERAYTEDSDRIFPVLSALREGGFCIEIDDFGTGASSLSMVADLPVDVLKLDRSFLSGFPDCPRHVETVRCMVRLAKALGLTLIIEGVETAAQAEKLCALGCQYAQGYYYSRPRPAEEFL